MSKLRRLITHVLLLPLFPALAKGADPADFNKPTEIEKAQSETAARMFNLYLEGKPVTDAYLKDVSKDSTGAAVNAQGQAAVDLAKKATPTFDPNRGMNIGTAVGQGMARSKVMGDITQDATAQRSAGMKSAVENALGIQSSANTAQAGLASDAVERNITSAQNRYTDNAATMSSISSLAGAGAGMGMSLYKKEAK